MLASSRATSRRPEPHPVSCSLLQSFLEKGVDFSGSIRIGKGSYSDVVTARLIHRMKSRYSVRLQRTEVAVKVIDKSRVSFDYTNTFLPKELLIWRNVSHLNIVRLLGHYEVDNCVYLTMEYGRQGDLLKYLKKNGPTPEPKASLWMTQIIDALSYLHGLSIAHRDLKVENIVIFSENLVKIADFGFATEVLGGRLSSTFCGSKAYSAPEVMLGKAYDPFLADIWSLGVVAYVTVLDLMPFNQNKSRGQLIMDHKNRSYVFPQTVPLDPQCRYTIHKMLSFRPMDRPTIRDVRLLPWPCNFNRR